MAWPSCSFPTYRTGQRDSFSMSRGLLYSDEHFSSPLRIARRARTYAIGRFWFGVCCWFLPGAWALCIVWRQLISALARSEHCFFLRAVCGKEGCMVLRAIHLRTLRDVTPATHCNIYILQTIHHSPPHFPALLRLPWRVTTVTVLYWLGVIHACTLQRGDRRLLLVRMLVSVIIILVYFVPCRMVAYPSFASAPSLLHTSQLATPSRPSPCCSNVRYFYRLGFAAFRHSLRFHSPANNLLYVTNFAVPPSPFCRVRHGRFERCWVVGLCLDVSYYFYSSARARMRFITR